MYLFVDTRVQSSSVAFGVIQATIDAAAADGTPATMTKRRVALDNILADYVCSWTHLRESTRCEWKYRTDSSKCLGPNERGQKKLFPVITKNLQFQQQLFSSNAFSYGLKNIPKKKIVASVWCLIVVLPRVRFVSRSLFLI